MKKLLFLLALACLAPTLQADNLFQFTIPPGVPWRPIDRNPKQITDEFGNKLWLYHWTEFNQRAPFRMPIGTLPKDGLLWVYTTPKFYRPVFGITNYTTVCTLTGLITGLVYVWQEQGTFRGWKDWRTTGTFFGLLGGGIVIGLELDAFFKPTGPPEFDYEFRQRH